MNISANDTFHSLLNLGDLPAHIDIVIREIRLPRTLLCMLVGAILALCGVVMQGLFRNPLAERASSVFRRCGARRRRGNCRPFSSQSAISATDELGDFAAV